MNCLKEVAQQARFQAMQPVAVTKRQALDAAIAAAPQQPEQIVLDLPTGRHRWSGYHQYPALSFSLFDTANRSCGHWGRMHGCEYGTTWYGRAVAFDKNGCKWVRDWDAVIDDFGDLVEVTQ